MAEPDLNLLLALDVLLNEASVAAAARRLGLSASAMSRTLSRLRSVTGDPLLVRAGRNMVLTPWAEALRERSQNVVFEARALLRPAVAEQHPASLDCTLRLRANDGFVEAFGPALIAAAAASAPLVRLVFTPKPEKSVRPLREGRVHPIWWHWCRLNQPAGLLHRFELPVKTDTITVSQIWHPRSEVDPAHRWLRQLLLAVCRQCVPD